MDKTIDIEVTMSPAGRERSKTTTASVSRTYPGTDYMRGENEMIEAAIKMVCEELYGSGTFWVPDSLPPGYGRVYKHDSPGGATMVASRVFVEIVMPYIGDEHKLALVIQRAELGACMELGQFLISEVPGRDNPDN